MSSRKPLNARPKSAMLSMVTVVRPCCLANSAYTFINKSLAVSLTSLRKSIICELPTSSRLPMIVFASTSEGVRYVIFVAGAGTTAGVSCSKSLIRCRKVFMLASNSATCSRSASSIGLRLAMRIRSACSCNASSIAAFSSINSALAGSALARLAALIAARASDTVIKRGSISSKLYFESSCLLMLSSLRIALRKSPSYMSNTPAWLCKL